MLSARLLRHKLSRCHYISRRNKYIVLLPEIPDDTPQTNPLLRTANLPSFSEISLLHCVRGVGKLLIDHEIGVHDLNTKLEDMSLPKTVQSVILPLEQLTVPLDFAWATFKLLYTLGKHEGIGEAYRKLHPRIVQAKREQYLSPFIYTAFKELKVDERLLAEPVQRVVNKFLLESRLSGMDLSDFELNKLGHVLVKLNEHRAKYRQKLTDCTVSFSQQLEMNDVKEFPESFLREVCSNSSNPLNGPWKVTLAPNIYQKFMEYCCNRGMRWNVWRAKHVRASFQSGSSFNNSIEIEEIRYNRKEQANILGFKTFAELSMKTKMAGHVNNVLAMLTTLKVKSKASTLRELKELQEFVSLSGHDYKLELWDVPYWQRKHKEKLYGLDQNEIRQYFPLPSVLKGVFKFCQNLFGIKITEAKADVDTWHPDVTFYKIYDENENPVASFFLDPYSRPSEKVSGAWMEIGRNRSDVVGAEPLAYMIFNFTPPQDGSPCMLSFQELRRFMQKFGHLLQHSLTTIPYSYVAGLTNLEWDVVNVCPMFMSYWLSNYRTVADMSSHVSSGQQIPADLHEKLIKDQNYMCALRLTEELYLAALDMEMYTRKEHWVSVTKKVWAEYMPFPFEKDQAHPCSFSEIFCDEFPAAYFSFLWAEMIAADLFSAFEEVGLDNEEALKKIGARFRETYLSLGGGCHPNEVFRRFRGRDPSIDALLLRYNLENETSA